jgi:NAD kinase
MADLAFSRLPRVTVDLSDLERDVWTPTAEVLAALAHYGTGGPADVWLAIGMEAVPRIRAEWPDGAALWESASWVIFERPDMPCAAELPPRHTLLSALRNQVNSEEVREMIYCSREQWAALVPPAVVEYIQAFTLFRGVPPPTTMPFCLPSIRALIVADTRNPLANDTAAKLVAVEDRDNPNVIVVIGGDGTMLRAIREHWRRRLPFFGVNAGHLGFLLNELPVSIARLLDPAFTFCGEVLLHHLPLLRIDVADGQGRELAPHVCFNDAWVERASGQSAWIQMCVNGETKLPRLVADGALVCTAAGSTAYAQSMGCCPVPVGTHVICVVGNNVSMPLAWRPVYLPLDCTIDFNALEWEKRPLRGFVDGVEIGPVSSMHIRTSNIADCRLIFMKKDTMLRKLSKLQFPSIAAAPVAPLTDGPFVPLPITPRPPPF